MAVEIAFLIALSIPLTNASSSSSFGIDAASSNHHTRLASFSFAPKIMIPSRVFAPLYVSREDRYSRTIFNRSPDSSSISNNNRRWEDNQPASVGKLDDDYGDRPDVTTMMTSSTSKDYDLYDQQMREEPRDDYRGGRVSESREWPQKQDYYTTDDNFEDSRSKFDDRDDNYSNVNDEYYNNNSPYYDRNDRYDFDMRRRRRRQLEPLYDDDDDYAQMRKSRYPRRIPEPPLPLSQLIRRKNEASSSSLSSRIVGELYTDNFRQGNGSNSENFRRGPIRDRSGRDYDVDLNEEEEDYYEYTTSYNGRAGADNIRSSSYDRWDQRGQQSDRATSFRGSRWQDTDDFMRTGDGRSPGQLVNSGREIAFNRSRSGLLGDSRNKKNLYRWQRDDASSSSLISSSAFSVGRRGVDDETDFRRRGERQQQQYGRDNIAFDRNRPQQYRTNDMSIDDNYYKERQNQLTKSTTFGQIRRVPTPPSQSRQQQQNSLNRLQMDSDNEMLRKEQIQQQQLETVQQRRRKNDRLVTTRQDKKPLVKQMMDGFTNLFTDKESTMSSTSNTSEEERVTRLLLSDARRCLLADPVIRDVLGGGGRGEGEKLTLGKIYSRSYTSTMVNGQTRSRVQLTFPINFGNSSSSSSSRDGRGITGQVTLIANQDEITRLQVDVDGRIVDVPCNR